MRRVLPELLSVVGSCLVLWTGVAVADAPSARSAWHVPPEGACLHHPPLGQPVDVDVDSNLPLPGEVIEVEQATRLAPFLPPELWEHRDRFLYPGMQMQIGPCYRDYGPPEFYRQATARLAGEVRLSPGGKLEGYRAGMPFPPQTIGPDDPRAALKWAWNWVFRYRGAGSFGSDRISIVSPNGTAASWVGSSFEVRLAGRADRPADGYRQPSRSTGAWASGGRLESEQTGHVCIFREYESGGRLPEFFVGSSYSHRMRRMPAPDSEGPLKGCLVDAAIGAGLFVHGGEPALHHWKIRGVVDLFAPINSQKPTYPQEKHRDFGPWGISFASDRWELRRVIVLEGRLKEGSFEDRTQHFVWYLDLQTLTPLYYAAYRRNGASAGVGYFVHRWSEDRRDYPHWPDDPERPVRVLDGIGEAFVDWNDQYAVRWEYGDALSVPPTDRKLTRMMSLSGIHIR
ncbi:MAG: DUF1329 domain-containing protein [Myxococcota bacterium]